MGAQVSEATDFHRFLLQIRFQLLHKMAPMKAVAAKKQMSKSEIAKTLATQHELKQKVCSDVLASFVEIACAEVKKNGIFTVPGLCRIKTRTKPATKAGVRNIFDKEVKVAAKPAKKVVKAFPVAALKAQI